MRREHPSSAEVAAYIDGALAPASRRRLAEHLAACDDCFELYSETLQSLHPGPPASPRQGLVPRRRTSVAARRWLAAAAAAVLLTAGVGAYCAYVAAARPRLEVVELVQTLRATDGLADKVWTGEVLRGGGGEEDDTDLRAVSFLVGAHLVGYQASIQDRDAGAAAAAADRLAATLARADFAAPAAAAFRAARSALRARRSVGAVGDLVAETSPVIDNTFLPVHRQLGAWAQAGRIAALAGSEPFFARRTNRRFLDWVLAQDEEAVDGEALARLRAIAREWPREPWEGRPLRRLAEEFTAILDRYEALGRREPSYS